MSQHTRGIVMSKSSYNLHENKIHDISEMLDVIKILHLRWCIQKCRTGLLERGLQMVQFSATRHICIAILWVSL